MDAHASREKAASETDMLTEVLDGLTRPQKALSPKYFYDETGSELFERITELEEYYPTRTERRLLEGVATRWVEELEPRSLVELGAGSAEKSRVLLSAMEAQGTGQVYVPLDVSGAFLQETARRLRAEYDMRVQPAVVDISEPFELPAGLPEPAWIALLGSTIGNFAPDEAVHLLRRIRTHLRSDDLFLLGVDQRPGPGKSEAMLKAAYNDAEGVTARFNLNVLTVLNRELGASFDPELFEHRAFYSREHHRIEMHLVARAAHEVDVSGTRISFRKGESIRTEISCKHDRGSIEALLERADLEIRRWSEDDEGRFALMLAATRAEGEG
jgi:L-histidine N-alpha-methyltransferase